MKDQLKEHGPGFAWAGLRTIWPILVLIPGVDAERVVEMVTEPVQILEALQFCLEHDPAAIIALVIVAHFWGQQHRQGRFALRALKRRFGRV